MFGNLPPSDVVKDAVIASTRSDKNNGYAPSIGMCNASVTYIFIRSFLTLIHFVPTWFFYSLVAPSFCSVLYFLFKGKQQR